LSIPHRLSLRIEPPCPITVAIEEDPGTLVASGVVADISQKGVCIWTGVRLSVGATLLFRLNFDLGDVHTLAGTVVWEAVDPGWSLRSAHYCGVKWLDVRHARGLLRQVLDRPHPQADRSPPARHDDR